MFVEYFSLHHNLIIYNILSYKSEIETVDFIPLQWTYVTMKQLTLVGEFSTIFSYIPYWII